MDEISPITHSPSDSVLASDLPGDLSRFEQVIRAQLTEVGLPAGQVFVEINERHDMLKNMSSVLGPMPEEIRGRSHYISKMIAATTVGLFDAALNYLWDELVSELRRRVAGFDLNYFFDIAVKNTDVRDRLRSEDDLDKIDDANLLRASKTIGLLTDVAYQRLDHIRYMRNHASAAHPNQVSLTGLDLANWLQHCIRELIITPPDIVTAETGRLLRNIKSERLDDEAIRAAANFFDRLPASRADTLANGLFGLYVDTSRFPATADNIRRLWPLLWPFVSEDTRSSYGIRLAHARANAETTDFSAGARELIDLVDGTAYLTVDDRTFEIDAALDALISAHSGTDNFYNEGEPARRLSNLVGDKGIIPEKVQVKYVKVLVEVYLGNGYGVSWAAEPTYSVLVEKLDSDLAGRALRTFMNAEISSLLQMTKARDRWHNLLELLRPKLTSNTDRELLKAINEFNGTPDKLRKDSTISKTAKRGQS